MYVFDIFSFRVCSNVNVDPFPLLISIKINLRMCVYIKVYTYDELLHMYMDTNNIQVDMNNIRVRSSKQLICTMTTLCCIVFLMFTLVFDYKEIVHRLLG